uniref:Single domain-containing protein n=1 Tax=Amblyomma triste TaxID=251400 RepID=A0A023G3N2_AMBTT
MLIKLGVTILIAAAINYAAMEETTNEPNDNSTPSYIIPTDPPDSKDSCSYNGTTIPKGIERHFGINKNESCVKVSCNGNERPVSVIGCPPPDPYLTYLKLKNHVPRPGEQWPWCCSLESA